MAEQHQPSSSSSSRRPSLSSKISAFGAKLSRTLAASSDGYSAADNATEGEENDSVSPIIPKPKPEIPLYRGREPFHSTGRGGAGNIRQASLTGNGPNSPSSISPDDFSILRGRQPNPHPHQNQVFSTGRGGAGNLRSPSCDADPTARAAADAAEQEVIREYVASQEGVVHSSGRGGLGNLNRSRSRDPAALPIVVYSTGRGGAGNVAHFEGAHHVADNVYEEEQRKQAHTHNTLHSTGRGGAANITSTQEPSIEHFTHGHSTPHEFESTGPGGLGNIVRGRSSSHHRT